MIALLAFAVGVVFGFGFGWAVFGHRHQWHVLGRTIDNGRVIQGEGCLCGATREIEVREGVMS